VLVSGTSPDKARHFADWVLQTTGIAAQAASPEATSAADIVAACTTSATPVVLAAHVREGAHVNAVGAFTPTTRELPTELMARARVYVDTRAGALAEAGDLRLAEQEGGVELDVVGELGEVLLGKAPGRTDAREVTVYKSVGAAFLDAVTARLALDEAGARAVGTVYAFDTE
jgi:ornithine cyclodeaminase